MRLSNPATRKLGQYDALLAGFNTPLFADVHWRWHRRAFRATPDEAIRDPVRQARAGWNCAESIGSSRDHWFEGSTRTQCPPFEEKPSLRRTAHRTHWRCVPGKQHEQTDQTPHGVCARQCHFMRQSPTLCEHVTSAMCRRSKRRDWARKVALIGWPGNVSRFQLVRSETRTPEIVPDSAR